METVCAIELRHITKRFGSVVANDGIDLTINYGEILSLLGENGSGKTTLMNMLAGIYFPDDGEILIGDVAFRTRVELEACKTQAGASWDEDEIYFVADELAPAFPQLKFVPFSACAGILSLRR